MKTISIPDELHATLKAHADATGVTLTAAATRLLDSALTSGAPDNPACLHGHTTHPEACPAASWRPATVTCRPCGLTRPAS